MKKFFVLFVLFVSTAAFAKDHNYQVGKLLDVSSRTDGGGGASSTSGNVSTTGFLQDSHAIFTVQVDDIVYTLRGERLSSRTKDYGKGLIVGDPVKVSIEGQDVFLQLPDGKDLKTRLLTRARVPKP